MSIVKLNNKGSKELHGKECNNWEVSTLLHIGSQHLNKSLYLMSLNLRTLTCEMGLHATIISETALSQGLPHSRYSVHNSTI